MLLLNRKDELLYATQSDAILLLNGVPFASSVKFYDGIYFIPVSGLDKRWDKEEIISEHRTILLEQEEFISLYSFQNKNYNSGVCQIYEGYLPFVWIDKKTDINFPQYSIEQARVMTYRYFLENIAVNELSAEYIESVNGIAVLDDFQHIQTIGNYYYITMPTMKAGFEDFDAVFNNITGNLFYISGGAGLFTE